MKNHSTLSLLQNRKGSFSNSLLNKSFQRIQIIAMAFMLFLCVSQKANAQIPVTVSGTATTSPALMASYTSLAAALTDLNAVTSYTVPGTIIFTCAAGSMETAPTTGLTLGSATLNPLLSATNTITIIKAGGTVTLNAGVGAAASPSATPDCIMKLTGADYVTIDGLTFTDGNSASATVAMEVGLGLFKLNAGDGCNNNTIQNCTFNMQRISNGGGTTPMLDGSWAIEVVNSTAAAATTPLTPTNGGTLATNGTNSGNKFYANSINNGNGGIGFGGFGASSGAGPTPTATTFLGDLGNDVGGVAIGTGNTILNFGGGAATSPSAGIRANNEWSINISYNTVNNNNGSGVNHTTTLRGIYAQAGTSANATVSNNIITLQAGATTSTVSAIENVIGSTAASNTVSISSNTIKIAYATATTGVINGILNTSTAATININSNDIQGVPSTNIAGTGLCIMISAGSSGGTLNTNSNTISNLNRSGASGTWRGIVGVTPPTAWNCTGNTIDGLSWTAVASTGNIDGIYNLSSALVQNINSNIIRNLSTPTTGTITGIRLNTVTGTHQCNNNQIYNFITTAGGAGGATFFGINSSNGVFTCSGNLIYTLNSTGTTGGTGGTVYGIQITGTTQTLSNNAIYDLSSTSTNVTVAGINITGGTTNNLSNNLIGDLRAINSTGNISISGILVGGGTTNNIFHNTVNIASTTASATTFGTSAIYFSSSSPVNNLRNNIFVNTSTPGPTGGFTAAIRYTSAPTTTNFPVTNNNNFYYSGVAAANKVLYCEGSSAAPTNGQQTIAAYKTYISVTLPASGRESASVSEIPNFISTTGSNPITTFLKYNTGIATQIEQGGGIGTGVSTDYGGTTRCPGGGCPGAVATPDMGAWELNGIPLDLSGPSISYTPLGNGCAPSTNQTLTATITDVTGVPTSGTGLPMLYYKVNAGAYTGVQGVSIGSNMYTFTFGAAATMTADVVSYYIVAQDVAGPPNASVSPSAGASGFSINPPAVSTPPTTPSAFTVTGILSGTYTVGAAGTYPTITAAVADYNSKCLGSAVVFNLIDASYSGETFPITINANLQASATNTLTIKTTLAATLISGSSTSALFVLNGADYVTIDGSVSSTPNTVCPVSTASRDLTITNTNTGTASAVVWLQTAVADGATNNTIKNCNLVGNSNTTTLFGIGSGSSTISITSSGTGNNNNSIINNNISKTQRGIYAQGASATNKNSGTIINQNLINTAAPNNVQIGGIFIGFDNGATISGNKIANINPSGAGAFAIALGIVPANTYTSLTGNEVTGANVSKNTIDNILRTGDGSSYGIVIAAVTSVGAASNSISNNMISNVNTTAATPSDSPFGIEIGGGATSSTFVYYNTIVMTGVGSNSANCFGIAIGGSNPTIDIRNNIMVNKQTSTTGKMYALVFAYSTFTNLTSNNNDFFVTADANHFDVGTVSFSSPTGATLASWKTSSGKDGSSVNTDPVFMSSSNLHIDGSNPANLPLDNGAVSIGAVTDDIDCEIRMTDIGADEFAPPSCAGAIGGTASITGASTFCTSGTPVINASGYSVGIGSTYQWMTSTVIGDYPTTGTVVMGQTNPASLTTGAVTVTRYYWLRVTCTTGLATDYSNMLTITINPSAATISGPSAKCSSDPAVTLNETGGTGTSWLWSTTQTTSSISVNPGSTTTYTVTVTSPGGCTAVTSKTVTVNPNPTGVSAMASVASICPGASFDLSSTSTPISPSIMTQDFDSGIGAWTTINNTTGGTPANTAWTIQPHPFTSTNSTPVTFNSPGGTNFILSNADLGGSGTSVFTLLQSPSFSTVGYSTLNLSFRHYYRFLTTTEAFVEVSTDGSTWNVLKSYGSTQGTPTAFVTDNISFDAYIGFPSVSIRFRYQDGWSWYWAIDDIQISGTASPYMYAWASSPSGFTSGIQNPTGVTQMVARDYIVTVTNGFGCSAQASTGVVGIAPGPSITLGSNPSVASCITTANLTYSATTGSPDQYSIDYDAAANTAGFTDVVNMALPATPIALVVPVAIAGTYNATLTVRNSSTSCSSISYPITVTINPPVVVNVSDAGAGSLRDIIACVASGSTITFDPSIWNSTILLTGPITINKNITLSGPTGADLINISAGGTPPVFNITSGNLQFIGNVYIKQ